MYMYKQYITHYQLRASVNNVHLINSLGLHVQRLHVHSTCIYVILKQEHQIIINRELYFEKEATCSKEQ